MRPAVAQAGEQHAFGWDCPSAGTRSALANHGDSNFVSGGPAVHHRPHQDLLIVYGTTAPTIERHSRRVTLRPLARVRPRLLKCDYRTQKREIRRVNGRPAAHRQASPRRYLIARSERGRSRSGVAVDSHHLSSLDQARSTSLYRRREFTRLDSLIDFTIVLTGFAVSVCSVEWGRSCLRHDTILVCWYVGDGGTGIGGAARWSCRRPATAR